MTRRVPSPASAELEDKQRQAASAGRPGRSEHQLGAVEGLALTAWLAIAAAVAAGWFDPMLPWSG